MTVFAEPDRRWVATVYAATTQASVQPDRWSQAKTWAIRHGVAIGSGSALCGARSSHWRFDFGQLFSSLAAQRAVCPDCMAEIGRAPRRQG